MEICHNNSQLTSYSNLVSPYSCLMLDYVRVINFLLIIINNRCKNPRF